MAERRSSVTHVIGGELRKSSVNTTALEATVLPSIQRKAFDTDSNLEEYYKPIEKYEGYHRYDPDYSWTYEEEKSIVRKVRKLHNVRSMFRYLPNSRSIYESALGCA